MKLKKLIKSLPIEIKGRSEIEITGISNNSKITMPGHLFVAKKGHTYDGNDFIQDAVDAGAIAVLTDLHNPFLTNVVQLIGTDIAALESELAKRFYRDPSSELKVFGITGTSGKTTTTYILKHLLGEKFSTGLIGTIETIINETRISSSLTTPDCISLQKILREMRTKEITHAAMEVSSHALDQNRVKDLSFDYGVFLNLSQEHLDYHKDMQTYALAKKKLFSLLKEGGVSLFFEESSFTPMMQEGVARRYLFGFSEACDFRATNLSHTLEGSAFTFHAEGQSIEMYVPLIGKYNLVNALAALSLAYLEGIDLETLKGALCTLAQIPGRMQRVDEIDKTVFVDYAHKPEALEKVLVALAPFKKGKIITLFGCGGMRDQIKRPKMASIAERLSDQVIITSDNPRREDPVAILEEIASGFTKENYEVIEDRREAIYRALEIASKDDIILIAGKGHEKMQYLETKSIPFDDVEVAKEFYNAIH